MKKYQVQNSFVMRDHTFCAGDVVDVQEGDKVLLNGVIIEFPVKALREKGWVIPTGPKSKHDSIVGNTNVMTQLPKNWEKLHWTKKKAWVETCFDAKLLEGLVCNETVKMKPHIEAQLTKCSKPAPETVPKILDKEELLAERRKKAMQLTILPELDKIPVGGLRWD